MFGHHAGIYIGENIVESGRSVYMNGIFVPEKDAKIYSTMFTELREKISQKNLFKPYPDINDIQN